MSVVARKLVGNALRNPSRLLRSCTKIQKRFFEAPQEELYITEIKPFLGTIHYWTETRNVLTQRILDEAEHLTDEDVKTIEHAIRVSEYMIEKQKHVTVFPYKNREEAGNDDQVASVYGNVGHKMGEELYYRVREGFDTEQEFYGESALYGPFGTEEDPVIVPAMGNHRFVGCMGGHNGFVEHEVAWFRVMQGPKHRCPICGQIFKLITTNTSHPDHPFHDPKRDYRGELIMTLINDP